MNGKTQMIKFNFSPPKGGKEQKKADDWLISWTPVQKIKEKTWKGVEVR